MKNTTLKVVAVLILAAIVSCNFEKNKNWNEMVWNDEFDYSGFPDSGKWEYDIEGNEWGWGNNEAQYYTRQRKENAWVEMSTGRCPVLLLTPFPRSAEAATRRRCRAN